MKSWCWRLFSIDASKDFKKGDTKSATFCKCPLSEGRGLVSGTKRNPNSPKSKLNDMWTVLGIYVYNISTFRQNVGVREKGLRINWNPRLVVTWSFKSKAWHNMMIYLPPLFFWEDHSLFDDFLLFQVPSWVEYHQWDRYRILHWWTSSQRFFFSVHTPGTVAGSNHGWISKQVRPLQNPQGIKEFAKLMVFSCF